MRPAAALSMVLLLVLPACSGADNKPDDKLSVTGKEVETYLRTQLEAQPGAPLDPSTFNCPDDEVLIDGSTINCSAQSSSGGIAEEFGVTAHEENGELTYSVHEP